MFSINVKWTSKICLFGCLFDVAKRRNYDVEIWFLRNVVFVNIGTEVGITPLQWCLFDSQVFKKTNPLKSSKIAPNSSYRNRGNWKKMKVPRILYRNSYKLCILIKEKNHVIAQTIGQKKHAMVWKISIFVKNSIFSPRHVWIYYGNIIDRV